MGTPLKRTILLLVAALTVMVAGIPAASATELPGGGTFVDDDLTAEEGYIEAIVAAGLVNGCNPPDFDEFCPKEPLTRAQMATVFVKAFDLPSSSVGHFTDIADSVHAHSIRAMAQAGITQGCNPPEYSNFCPDKPVRRGQFAKFLVNALDLPATDRDYFSDDDESIFEASINALAAAGFTSGCADGAFCPDNVLPRRQMAVILSRVLDLDPIDVPKRPPPPYPDVGDGKRIIYSNSEQRVWLIDESNDLVDTYLVSGRVGIPHYGTYSVYSKSVKAYAPYGGITMRHMVRFVRPRTFGNQWAYGFHSIPRYPNGAPMQTEDELGFHLSGGCVRQADDKAAALYQWAEIGLTVHAIP